MVNTEIPKGLPDCDLIKVLAEKVEQRHDIDFNFFGRLDDFRQRVSDETRQINELFPEYTPHDGQYHLRRLFNVADTIIGKERLEAMNSTELFILAVGLYGHDWGMAVSELEKQYILTNELPKEEKAEDLWILPDERLRLSQFAHRQRLPMDSNGRIKDIPIEVWREYIRETHADRSGERVRRFFEPIDGGIADAASRVCAGHWVNFEKLQDHNLYPADFSALRETINIRAIAVYLRLVDLFDLAEDRTPYVIWKFVAPRDPRSKMEWEKHRALRPVTCPPYQEGRTIKVIGKTDNHEVYAALEDLKLRCEEELRGCNDILARMKDPRHKLDIYNVDWHVAAHGFEPISIQFEFDRERMFEILSDEIYNGDPYVFLRELLQNSVDAIRMRREVLKSHGIEPKSLGAIYVDVKHGNNGDAVITWRDDGIGMDEYIIRNYLSVAGKSYYRSSDFERLGLKMDPISKFGIGILSCFVAADRVEIETFKEPYLHPRSERLKIIIPAVDRQFRIETLSQEGAPIGTTVKVFVEGRKIPLDDKSKSVKPLDVTGYISIVAGFVEFPIVITEGDHKTIVLHPEQDAEDARKRFGKEFKVHQLDLNYPWSEAILPQDLSTAREVLREEHRDIASDFNLEGYEGVFTYLVPIDDSIDLSGFSEQIKILSKGEHIKTVRQTGKFRNYYYIKDFGLSPSSMHSIAYTVYRDGILLSAASKPQFLLDRDIRLPIPKLLVNLPKTTSPKIDLARSKILGQAEHWDTSVYQAYQNFILQKSLKCLLELDPAERLYQLGRLIAYYNIQPESILQIFPMERWPLPFLEAGGHFNILEWQVAANDVFYGPPEYIDIESGNLGIELNPIEREFGDLSCCLWLTYEKYDGLFTQWTGERCFILNFNSEDDSSSIIKAGNLGWFFINKFYRFESIRFLQSPWKGFPPLLQRIWHRKEASEKNLENQKVLEMAVENPTFLNHEERELLQDITGFPEFVEFPNPFARAFIYGDSMLNLNHPVTQALLRFVSSLKLLKMHKTLPDDRIGYLEDTLQRFMDRIRGFGDEKPLDFKEIWSLARETHLFDIEEFDEFVLTPADFIKLPFPAVQDFKDLDEIEDKLAESQPFGMPL
ncbi:MAG: ATP-binding protein [Candidatus Methanoperedens sp.]